MSAPDVQRGRLVLCRFVGQRVVLRGDIVVELVAIEGDQVRLLFDAPREIPILREELIPTRHRPDSRKPRPTAPPGIQWRAVLPSSRARNPKHRTWR